MSVTPFDVNEMETIGFQSKNAIKLMDPISIQDILVQYNFNCLAISYIKDTLFALYNDTLVILKLSKISKLIENPELTKNDILDNVHEFKCEAPNGGCQIYLSFNDTLLYLITFSGEIYQLNVDDLIQSGKLTNLGTITTNNSILRFIPSSESEAALVLSGSNELLLVKSNSKSLLLEDISAVNWVHQSDSEIIFSIIDSNEVIIANINDIGNPIKSYQLNMDEFVPMINDFKFFSESKYLIITSDSEIPNDQITFIVDGETFQKSDSIFTAFSMVDRLANSNVQNLPNWSQTFPELMVGASSASEDISILTPSFQLKPLNDQDMATLPMVDDNDTTNIGFAIDLTSTEDVIEPCMGVDKSGPLPRVYILNDYGQLLSWNIWLSSDIRDSKLDLKKSLEAITSHKPKHITPVVDTKTATSFSFMKPEETKPTTANSSSFFGSQKTPVTGFGSGGFGSSGFGSSGFDSKPAVKKPEVSIGQGGFGAFASTATAFGSTLNNQTSSGSPFSDIGTTNNNSLFGSVSNPSGNTQVSAFGSLANTNANNTLFGADNESGKSNPTFGSDSPFGTAGKNMSSLFGSQNNGNDLPKNQKNGSLFGSSTQNQSAVEKQTQPTSIFGSFGDVKTAATPNSLFGNQSAAVPAANPFGNANSLGDFGGLSNALESNKNQPQFSFKNTDARLDFHNDDDDDDDDEDDEFSKPAGINFDDSDGDEVDSDDEEEAEIEKLKLEEQRLFRETADKKLKEEHEAKEAAEKKTAEEHLAREVAEKKSKEEHAAKVIAEKKLKEEHLAREAAEKKAKEEHEAKEAAEKNAKEEHLARELAEKKAEEEHEAKVIAEKKLREEHLAREAAEKQLEEEHHTEVDPESLPNEEADDNEEVIEEDLNDENEDSQITEESYDILEEENEQTTTSEKESDPEMSLITEHENQKLEEKPEVSADMDTPQLSAEEEEELKKKKAREQIKLERAAALKGLTMKKNNVVTEVIDKDDNKEPVKNTEKDSEELSHKAIEEGTNKGLEELEVPVVKEVEVSTAETDPIVLIPVSVDVQPEQTQDDQDVDLNITESVDVQPSYTPEATTFETEEHSVLAFEGDEAYQSKFYIPKSLPMLVARGSVEYPEDLSKYKEVGKEIMKIIYDVDAEFMVLGKNVEQLTEFLSDHNENKIISHSLKSSSEFPSHWRFFELGTILKGINKITPAYEGLLNDTTEICDGIKTIQSDIFSLTKIFVSLGRELEDLEKSITKSAVESNNINRPLGFEQVQARRALQHMAVEVRNNYERLSEVILILNSRIHPERIINPQFDSVLSSMQRSIHNHMDILRDLKYEVKKFTEIPTKTEDQALVKFGMKLEEDTVRHQMEQILSLKRRKESIFNALATRSFRISTKL